MESQSGSEGNLGSTLRVALLVAGLATYLVSPDDVVWKFVRTSQHARLLEHFGFGLAAVLLGIALLLKVQASTVGALSTTIGSLFQPLGIGSLLPLPGFLLFVVGELGITSLIAERESGEQRSLSWKASLAEHTGLCCTCASIIVFSIVLIDRVADALFALSAIASIAVSFRRALGLGRSHR